LQRGFLRLEVDPVSGNLRSNGLAAITALLCVAAAAGGAAAVARTVGSNSEDMQQDTQPAVESKSRLDRSGRKRVGTASFYAKQFAGRKMADGTPMRPHGDNAASKTLPLGTTATVTNLETGKSAVVTIRDRGPYVKGRIVDLSPATARKIGLTEEQGLAEVEVAPIVVPLADGRVKLGDAFAQLNSRSYPRDWSN
jgi:rare lipoprotein A